jgi:hypothetical protein
MHLRAVSGIGPGFSSCGRRPGNPPPRTTEFGSPQAPGKPGFENKKTTKNVRNENELMLFFRWISWHLSSLLRELLLKRGQLPSFPYSTWLSLPFLVYFVHCGFCHIFMFFWYRDIHFVPVPEFKRFKTGIFMDRGRKTRRRI